MNKAFSCCITISLALIASDAVAQTSSPMQTDEEQLSEIYEEVVYSPFAGAKYPQQPLWGDSHLHTSLSFDAGGFGNRLPPSVAYRFAREKKSFQAQVNQSDWPARSIGWPSQIIPTAWASSMMCWRHPRW